jgi:hypothetical protein
VSLVAADRAPAPGFTDGRTCFFPRDARLDGAGRIAFLSNFEAGGAVTSDSESGLFVGPPGAPVCVFRNGQPVPEAPGLHVSLIPGHYALSQSSGLVAVDAFMDDAAGNTVGRGVWAGPAIPGGPRLLVRAGDPVPGMPGSHFDQFAVWAVNDAGEVAFYAQLDIQQPDGVDDSVLCVTRPDGSLRVVARTGARAPGLPAGVRFWRLAGEASLNNAGHVAVFGLHDDPSVLPSQRRSIWAGRYDDLRLLVTAGQAAPETEPGTVFTDSIGGPYMGVTSARVAFHAHVSGPSVTPETRDGVWAGSPGFVHKVLRSGDPAPDLPAGVTVNSISACFMSTDGRLVIRGQLAGVPLIAGNLIPDAVWAEDEGGRLRPVMQAGQPFEIAPGETLTTFAFNLSAEGGYAPSQARQGFNAAGRVVFTALFFEDDQTALMVADVPPGCRADYNHAGGADLLDIFAFLNEWFAGDPRADFNRAGGVGLLDIFAFLGAWFAGC